MDHSMCVPDWLHNAVVEYVRHWIEDMPPHIYAMGQMTYREMLQSRSDQSIVFMGRSGSGKTSNSGHVMQ
jgi:myosin heavy subunit